MSVFRRVTDFVLPGFPRLARRLREAGRLALVTSAIALAGSCSDEVTAPTDLGTLSFVIVSGDGQSGVVDTELPQPLVIRATTPAGAAIADLTVNFRVTSGGGSVFAGSASTNNQGIAKDYWTLGTSTAAAQALEVRAVLPNGNKRVFGVFTATPLAGPAAQIVVQAGDGQTANASSSVPIAPAALVSDQYGNPVPSLDVTFAVASGGGSVTGGNTTTNTGGVATVGSWTLGPVVGSNTLTATASGSGIAGNPVTFMATSDFWTTKASMTTARFALGVAAINGILYAVGGDNTNDGNLATVEAYDPATDTWTTKASMPTARKNLGVAAINGILYAVGGFNSNDNSLPPLPTVEAYDPATDTWTTKASMLTARRNLGVAAINGILYALGPTNTVEAYDPATDTWTTKASMSTGRFGPGVGVVNGILYAVGGHHNNALATLEAYDPATDTWTTKASMPTAREGLGVAAINGILYAVGGVEFNVLPTVEAYDPATDTWTTRVSMPTAREGLGVAAINGTLYAVGGGDLSTVEAYQP
jgi:energy-converting hydrogenase Eha subunit A